MKAQPTHDCCAESCRASSNHRGIATLEIREKSHFVKVEPHEFAQFDKELEASDV